jgi:hypothetical protein
MRLNYYTGSLIRGIQNLLLQEPYKRAETDFRAKFGKETIAGVYRRPKWVLYYNAQADSGRAQDAQACSGSAQACSPSDQVRSPSAQACSPLAQVKAAVAHVRRLKRNQRKGKLILSLWVLCPLEEALGNPTLARAPLVALDQAWRWVGNRLGIMVDLKNTG